MKQHIRKTRKIKPKMTFSLCPCKRRLKNAHELPFIMFHREVGNMRHLEPVCIDSHTGPSSKTVVLKN